ncbi:MAG: hypothetical protein RIR62_3147 [Pseudomonadota bacterium]|jgi:hypothetical protein
MPPRAALFLSLALLAACGADGPPTAPQPEPGITVTGEARIGVVSQ